jgi:pilus assembly protein Flp/PilA
VFQPRLGKLTPEGTQMNTLLLKSYVKFQNLMNREEGQGMVEYGLIVALIALGLTAALSGIGSSLKSIFQNISTTLAAA